MKTPGKSEANAAQLFPLYISRVTINKQTSLNMFYIGESMTLLYSTPYQNLLLETKNNQTDPHFISLLNSSRAITSS